MYILTNTFCRFQIIYMERTLEYLLKVEILIYRLCINCQNTILIDYSSDS